MILEFLTAYQLNPGEPEVRDITMIVPRYVQGNFLPDLLPLVPLHWMFKFENGQEKLLILVKTVRLWRGLSIFKAKYIKYYLSSYFKWRQKAVLDDPDICNSKFGDYN